MTDKPVPVPSDLSEPYWEGAARGDLMAQRCRACDVTFLYARQWCPNCGSADIDWTTTSGLGTVECCTVVHHPPFPAYAKDVPYVIAIVKLDEGAQLMCNVVDCEPADVHVGQRVAVTFEKRGDMVLPQFRPDPPTRSATEP